MKQFSLDEFKKNPSRKIVTRDGREVRIICTDFQSKKPIIGLVKIDKNEEGAYNFSEDGRYNLKEDVLEDNLDLFFVTIKREGWANVYGGKNDTRTLGCLFSSEEEAIKHKLNESVSSCIKTIKIEWEE